jgi:hypothetical protein
MDIKKTIISIAIAIIFVLFIGYGIEVFDRNAKMEEFCPNVYDIDNEADCAKEGGIWGDEFARGPKPVMDSGEIREFCSQPYDCYDNWGLETSKHDKVVFVVSVIVGILAIIGGMLLKKDAISTGILGGAVLLLLYGTIRYWRHANDILKFVLLGIVLAVLIWIGYKKLK